MITAEQERALTEIGERHPQHFMVKFCTECQQWYRTAMRTARQMGLQNGQPLRTFDLGCGFGYFILACRKLGHHVQGLDLPDWVIQGAATVLGITYWPHTITAQKPLPLAVDHCDLITTFGVNFRHSARSYWGWDEYRYLAQDVLSRLNPGGRWVLRPNQASASGKQFSDLFDQAAWQTAVGDFAHVAVRGPEVELRPNGHD